jgi:hypothetical protein
MYCTSKFEKHKRTLLSENYGKLSPIESIKDLMHMKSVNNLSLVKTIIEVPLINIINPHLL